jgi:alpha-L-fucosidase
MAVNAQSRPPERRKYEASLVSLALHPVPDWFDDAKLGVLVTYGLYSVPGYAPPSGELGKVDFKVWFQQNPYAEWYENSIKILGTPSWKYHVAHYGENFKYADFIPLFQKESAKWKPEDWARLFKEAGIRYAVFTSKFADGYPLWPTAVKHPKLPFDHLAAGRDYVGDFTKAMRAEGLQTGLYYCGGMDWVFMPEPVQTFMDVFRYIPQSGEYAKMADAHWRELMERYQPDILWNDISYPQAGDAAGILASFYNQNPRGVVNNRFGYPHADFTTPEYSKLEKISLKKWETCRGFGYTFGYNRAETAEHMLSPKQVIALVADIVSKNGNLLIGIGPAADGTISALQLERLHALGRWLQVNGEAIYGTRPWVSAEGKVAPGGAARFTCKGDSVYAILLDLPQSAKVTLEGLVAEPGSTVTLLGRQGSLKWSQSGTNLEVTLPGQVSSEAFALKISPRPAKLLKELQVAREGAWFPVEIPDQ